MGFFGLSAKGKPQKSNPFRRTQKENLPSMAVKRKFHVPMSALLYEADLIITAAENQSTFAAKRWLGSDSDALDTAVQNVGDIDKQQQDSQTVGIAGTDDRNNAANDLYDIVLTIQNPANIEWPAKDANNRATRESFRLGIFPPSGGLKVNPPPGGGEVNGGSTQPPK